jgi:dephospho-CoA kinase
MTVIGVTGPSGAGKSLFCSYLEEFGCLHLDCDKIYHSLVDSPSECTRALEAEFSSSIINPDGSLDRIALGVIVFAPGADKLRARLNEITHAFVLAEVRKAIKSQLPISQRQRLQMLRKPRQKKQTVQNRLKQKRAEARAAEAAKEAVKSRDQISQKQRQKTPRKLRLQMQQKLR